MCSVKIPIKGEVELRKREERKEYGYSFCMKCPQLFSFCEHTTNEYVVEGKFYVKNGDQ